MVTVISLGGSIVAPDKPDPELIKGFKSLITEYLAQDDRYKIILVVGGGGPARSWQQAFRDVEPNGNHDAQDWIGIMATRLNAQLLKAVFGDLCIEDVVTDPTVVNSFTGRVLVAAGWKPGFSTDFDAVLLALRFGAKEVINLSNITKVFTADPKHHKDAVPLDTIDWKGFRTMVGDDWVPGKNVPFDPIAAKRAAEGKLKVVVAGGRDLENVKNILNDKPFEGTLIGPE